MDEGNPVRLEATDSIDLKLHAGKHRLGLLGVASQCSVDAAAPLEVEVRREAITVVRFDIHCPLTGATISVSTSGLDPDTTGYAVLVDGVERGHLDPAGVLVLRLEPGAPRIALADLEPNCTAEEQSRRVTVVSGEVATVPFVVTCRAFGVIRVVVHASGPDLDGPYSAMVDGHRYFASYRAPSDVIASSGRHTVSVVAPRNCTVHTGRREVTVTAGGPVRDTVEVSFSVGCVRAFGYVRITVATIGAVPVQSLNVWVCDWADRYYCAYSTHTWLGPVVAGASIVAGLSGGDHRAWLDLPAGCGGTTAFFPSPPFTVTRGDTVDVQLGARC